MPVGAGFVAPVLAALLAAPLGRAAPVAAAQGAGEGLIDERTYGSPRCGYEVAWEAPWTADPARTRSGGGAGEREVLPLGERNGNRTVRREGFVDGLGLDDPLADRADVETPIGGIAAALDETRVAPVREATVIAADPSASPPTLTYDFAVGSTVPRATTSLPTTETGGVRIVFAEMPITFPNGLAAALADVQASVTVADRPAREGAEPVDGGGFPVASR